MKTLWRTRRDSLIDDHTPAIDQSLADGPWTTRAVKPAASSSDWTAPPLRPVAHWVSMPAAAGGSRLEMIWETPDPMPATLTG